MFCACTLSVTAADAFSHDAAATTTVHVASIADAITLTELPERLAHFDIIVTSTASSLPILGKGMLERAIKARRHAPMFIVDLAVPRDVEPEAAALDDVFLYSVDDLANIVKDNLQIRVEAVREAEAMIATQAESFLRWLEGRTVVPMIAARSAS